eukprot:CAMPEP_0168343576 /NCGR_PEP_ID=MMETSP0213-20121227/16193_1 /TAXON_ID=151035 /ORGANISM="Euplotes harpa, Strain FSP1.4" /LENGTH=183 /DNA_ID=CAMNT_0008350933 /DNA_START=15 /DNA_END=566 /DNA_ORIENTATION=+
MRKQARLAKLAFRSFSAGHGHEDHHGHEHDDHHGHGHHVELPDPNSAYFSANSADKKFLALKGLKPVNPSVQYLNNPAKHLNDLHFFDMEMYLSAHVDGHLTYEEEHLHGESYGYVRGDDPFEPHGKLDTPLIFMVLGIAAFLHFSYAHFSFIKEKSAMVKMHERLTAGMLEDKIREIRQGNI